MLGLASCAGAPPKPAAEKHEDTAPKWDDSEPTGDESNLGEPRDDSTDEPAGKQATPANDDYDIGMSDCNALAHAYGNAWERAEREQLDAKKLPPKQHDGAAEAIHKAAVEAHDNWLDQCGGIVGTPVQYHRLKCALSATTVARFNACWDGKAEE